MRQNLNKLMQTKRNFKAVRESNLTITRGPGHGPRSADETLHFQQALADAADVRAEKVARGKALVADPNYPSKEQIRKIAGILAGHLSNCESGPSESKARDLAVTRPVPETGPGLSVR